MSAPRSLSEVASLIAQGQREAAKIRVRELAERNATKPDLRSFLFLSALGASLDQSMGEVGNLYLRQFATSQIDLFGLLGRAMPLVTRVSESANRVLLELAAPIIASDQPLAIIDIGIGKGRQMAELLKAMSAARKVPRSLNIIGIEPSEESLEHARSELMSLARTLGVALHFEAKGAAAETLAPSDWQAFARQWPRPLVNAAFALHHVRSEQKDAVLASIASLHPEGFVLSEPHSDHETSDLVSRLDNSWKHYGLVFDVIDAQPVDEVSKNAMKVQFFAREIQDVVGTPEVLRSERHETAAMWVARLRKVGLKPHVGVPGILADADFEGISRRWRGDHLNFEFAQSPVVSMMTSR